MSSHALATLGVVIGILGAVAGVVGVIVAVFALRAANRSANAAVAANEISARAEATSQRAAGAAHRSAQAAEAHVELERVARGAQLFVVGLRHWVEGASPGASSIIIRFGNSGGSIARDLVIAKATIEGVTYLTPTEAIDLPQGTEGEATMLLPIPPRDESWPPFELTVRLTDANGARTQTLPPFQGHPRRARVINLRDIED